MLLKQFLNESEKKQLLNIALSLKYEKDGNGKDVFLEFLSDTNELNNIIYKINKKFNEHFFGFTYIKEHSIFLRINNNGWVSVHQDWVEDRQHVINFNVLLTTSYFGVSNSYFTNSKLAILVESEIGKIEFNIDCKPLFFLSESLIFSCRKFFSYEFF
jgi:hypothetical protein